MKKNSRTIESTTVETIGIDLGDKISHYCVLDDEGQVVEEGRFRNRAESIVKHFRGRLARRVALEAGAQSAWIAAELRKLGLDVIVANATQVALIGASTRKNDRNDAEKLARLARVDPQLLSPIEHRSEAQQCELNAIRARDALVRARAVLVNAARGLAKTIGHRLPPTITATFGKRAMAALPEPLRPALGGLLEEIDKLGGAIESYDKQVLEMVERHPEAEALAAVPGVGPLTALTFVLTLGRAERFARSRDVGSYLGLRPRQRQSGDADPQLGISKTGNSYLRKLLVQCAHHVLGHWGRDSALRQWGLRLAERGGSRTKKRAIVAVARKLAVLLHRLWRTGATYQPFYAAA
jgi:transposase